METHVIQNQETFSLQSEHYNIDLIVVSDAVKCQMSNVKCQFHLAVIY